MGLQPGRQSAAGRWGGGQRAVQQPFSAESVWEANWGAAVEPSGALQGQKTWGCSGWPGTASGHMRPLQGDQAGPWTDPPKCSPAPACKQLCGPPSPPFPSCKGTAPPPLREATTWMPQSSGEPPARPMALLTTRQFCRASPSPPVPLGPWQPGGSPSPQGPRLLSPRCRGTLEAGGPPGQVWPESAGPAGLPSRPPGRPAQPSGLQLLLGSPADWLAGTRLGPRPLRPPPAPPPRAPPRPVGLYPAAFRPCRSHAGGRRTRGLAGRPGPPPPPAPAPGTMEAPRLAA